MNYFIKSCTFNKNLGMSAETIMNNLLKLNYELEKRDVIGEIALVGGAVMCLVFKSRESTEDIDAIFEPKSIIYECSEIVRRDNNLPKGWLNDSVKGFLSSEAEFIPHLKLSNLNILVASPEYMLAMKCLSARMENINEKSDISFLLRYLKLKTYDEVENIILKFYPAKRFHAKTKFAIMEILDELFN